jgi:hypothetical protein
MSRRKGPGDGATLPLGTAPRPARDLLSSAASPTSPPTDQIAGAVTLSGECIPEELARELINRRFAASGYRLEADYSFHHEDILVVLDGFDSERRAGYQYISHADADVVTDHDVATSDLFKRLAAGGGARVLVIHDGEAPTGDALIAIVDQFLAGEDPG